MRIGEYGFKVRFAGRDKWESIEAIKRKPRDKIHIKKHDFLVAVGYPGSIGYVLYVIEGLNEDSNKFKREALMDLKDKFGEWVRVA